MSESSSNTAPVDPCLGGVKKSVNPIRGEKLKKLEALKERGLNPFPHFYKRTAHISQILDQFSPLEAGESREQEFFSIAGRLMTKRPMGKAVFFNLQDSSGSLQCYLKTQDLDESSGIFYENVDIGDIVGVRGFVFKTRKGELSLRVQSFQILCKSLEPLPEKYHGIQDVELKYRHRHLDLIMTQDSRRIFETRSQILHEIRSFMRGKGFMEVETPVLQPLYGGARAFPFSTRHRALDMKMYLKISPELYLKKLIVGGFEKVFELGKNFRNEGVDRSHNPEFTMLEWYEAYTDYKDQMDQFEELVAHLAVQVCGSLKVTYQGEKLDFTPPWKRLSLYEAVYMYGGLDGEKASLEEIFKKLKDIGSQREKMGSRGEMLMEVFELSGEKKIRQPTFLIDFPIEVSPLTKKTSIPCSTCGTI